ncbi:small ribosomal subunit protein mS37-like [Mytilus edulis]|uniref:small ribosomal subunit protein mS37-like n=1 Tax=Mytilus edulis TaxID=6550 RepID=UPI0039EF537E
MTRLTVPLFAAKRPLKKFTNYLPKHPYKILLPPVLKNNVQNVVLSDPQGKQCLGPMSELMQCWKNNDFAVDKCVKENNVLQDCMRKAAIEDQKIKEKIATGKEKVLGRYNNAAVNKMLRKFPQPPHSIKPK